VNDIEIADTKLMALADGELSETDARMMRNRIASDPMLAARFAVFVETRALAQPAIHAPAEQVPKRLIAAIVSADAALPRAGEKGPITSAPRRATPRAQRRPLWQLPLAASVVFTLGGLAGYLIASSDSSRGSATAQAILAVPAAHSSLTQALDGLPSGRELRWSDRSANLSGRIVILSTHKLSDATYCREYEIAYEGRSKGAVVGASCRRDGRWRTEIVASKPDQNSGYSPASGATAVDQYLANLGSSGALSAADETARISQGW
jgi:surface antigen